MIDRDLAELYDVETSYLKRRVKRNIDRFPEDFMFLLNNEEFENLRSQNGTSSWGGARYAPMVFTEQGVAQLSSVLNSSRAIQVNIQIIRLFTKMRTLLLTPPPWSVAHHSRQAKELNLKKTKINNNFGVCPQPFSWPKHLSNVLFSMCFF